MTVTNKPPSPYQVIDTYEIAKRVPTLRLTPAHVHDRRTEKCQE